MKTSCHIFTNTTRIINRLTVCHWEHNDEAGSTRRDLKNARNGDATVEDLGWGKSPRRGATIDVLELRERGPHGERRLVTSGEVDDHEGKTGLDTATKHGDEAVLMISAGDRPLRQETTRPSWYGRRTIDHRRRDLEKWGPLMSETRNELILTSETTPEVNYNVYSPCEP